MRYERSIPVPQPWGIKPVSLKTYRRGPDIVPNVPLPEHIDAPPTRVEVPIPTVGGTAVPNTPEGIPYGQGTVDAQVVQPEHDLTAIEDPALDLKPW